MRRFFLLRQIKFWSYLELFLLRRRKPNNHVHMEYPNVQNRTLVDSMFACKVNSMTVMVLLMGVFLKYILWLP